MVIVQVENYRAVIVLVAQNLSSSGNRPVTVPFTWAKGDIAAISQLRKSNFVRVRGIPVDHQIVLGDRLLLKVADDGQFDYQRCLGRGEEGQDDEDREILCQLMIAKTY